MFNELLPSYKTYESIEALIEDNRDCLRNSLTDSLKEQLEDLCSFEKSSLYFVENLNFPTAAKLFLNAPFNTYLTTKNTETGDYLIYWKTPNCNPRMDGPCFHYEFVAITNKGLQIGPHFYSSLSQFTRTYDLHPLKALIPQSILNVNDYLLQSS